MQLRDKEPLIQGLYVCYQLRPKWLPQVCYEKDSILCIQFYQLILQLPIQEIGQHGGLFHDYRFNIDPLLPINGFSRDHVLSNEGVLLPTAYKHSLVSVRFNHDLLSSPHSSSSSTSTTSWALKSFYIIIINC